MRCGEVNESKNGVQRSKRKEKNAHLKPFQRWMNYFRCPSTDDTDTRLPEFLDQTHHPIQTHRKPTQNESILAYE